MITNHNYSVEIWTNSGLTNSDIGLDNGTYKWCLTAVEPLADYKGDILADNGISNLVRSCDMRTGGGLSTEQNATVTIQGGFFDQIDAFDQIIGKRIRIREFTYNGVAWLNSYSFTGVINSPDIRGFETILNCTVESMAREVDLPYQSGAFGNVSVDGVVTGETGYIQTKGYKTVFQGYSSVIDIANDRMRLEVRGATPSAQALISTIVLEMVALFDSGYNLFYEGTGGTYKVIQAPTYDLFDATAILYFGSTNSYTSVEGEVGEFGSVLYSNEVYNSGIDGSVIVEVDGNKIEIDDINGNVVEYKDGKIVDAGDGIAWRKLEEGTDYDTTIDTTGKNEAITDITNGPLKTYFQSDGAYTWEAEPKDTVTPVVVGLSTDATDWNYATERTATATPTGSTSTYGIYQSLVFSMSGYRFNADRLYAVIDVDATGRFATTQDVRMEMSICATSYDDAGHTSLITKKSVTADTAGILSATLPSAPYTFSTMPKNYNATPVDADQFNFYNAQPFGETSPYVSITLDITDLLLDIGDGELYYDGVSIYLGAGVYGSQVAASSSAAGITVRQINLVEGYDIGREGLKNNKINIDNTLVNGTTALAYEDVVKRQNLFGINSTPPVDGWGTEQVQTDGEGANIDGNYLTSSLPTGDLNGDLGQSTTTSVKKEIARSIPAVAYYTNTGVESLLNIGDFASGGDVVGYDQVEGELEILGYSGRDIQPSLSFEFGQDKLRLQINNIEASAYSSAYIVDDLGISAAEKNNLWDAGHALYLQYGTTTSQIVRRYPIVNSPDDAYRIASALYSNMGYFEGRYYRRSQVTATLKKSNRFDIGDFKRLEMPQVTGDAVVSSVNHAVYGGGNTYKFEVLEESETNVPVNLFYSGSETDDVLYSGSETDNILKGA